MIMIWRFLIIAVFWCAHLGTLSAIELGYPLKCYNCPIQNHVDITLYNEAEPAKDYMCTNHVYDGHKGTDFRALNMKHMLQGIPVIAAASGKVKGVRNQVPDEFRKNRDHLEGIECGNGVVIQHPNGYETQYCHMKQLSITVKVGEKVEAGQQIGMMGMSGRTQFPHLHFSVRKNGKVIDPFLGEVPLSESTKCMTENITQPPKTLWGSEAEDRIKNHSSTGILGASFSNLRPSKEEVEMGFHDHHTLDRDLEKLFFWINIYGLREGDVENIILHDPKGKVFARFKSKPSEKNMATRMRVVMKRFDTNPQFGEYIASYKLIRDGKTIIDEKKKVFLQ